MNVRLEIWLKAAGVILIPAIIMIWHNWKQLDDKDAETKKEAAEWVLRGAIISLISLGVAIIGMIKCGEMWV